MSHWTRESLTCRSNHCHLNIHSLSSALYLSPFWTPVTLYFELRYKKISEHLSIAVPNTPIFSFRTPGSFFYEHPSSGTLSCDTIHSEHPFYWLRTSVRFFSEHPLEDLNVNSEHPMSKTDVQNDRDETSGRRRFSLQNNRFSVPRAGSLEMQQLLASAFVSRKWHRRPFFSLSSTW